MSEPAETPGRPVRRRVPIPVRLIAVTVVVALSAFVFVRSLDDDLPSSLDPAWTVGQSDLGAPAEDRSGETTGLVVGDLAIVAGPGGLFAFGTGDGVRRWDFPIPQLRYCGVTAGPDAVYLTVRPDEAPAATGPCSELVRVGMDGREQWRSDLGPAEPDTGSRSSTAGPLAIGATTGDVALVGARSITARAARDGSTAWTATIEQDMWGESEYGGGCAFRDAIVGPDVIATTIGCERPLIAAGTSDTVLEFRSRADGSVLHRGSVFPGGDATLVHATRAGAVLVGSPGTSGAIVDFVDGSAVHVASYRAPGVSASHGPLATDRELRNAVIAGDLLVLLPTSGLPAAIRISTGRTAWSAQEGPERGGGDGPAVVWKSALLVGDGRVFSAYDLETGALRSDAGIDIGSGPTGDRGRTASTQSWSELHRAGDRIIGFRLDSTRRSVVGLREAGTE
ncbi:hypothetical protein CFN78_17865 [Amycolatopsis antarctica]|uniref:Uncharacterized protein n=1 Tax=Amycolatopsis antarctica TaxID=1854586 RepID=A0A263D0X5_9PSEU|nr:PQQ-binding-like beta-propeller repeat protein [Amycolatopsis antarctica]OZM72001.1 hypothetical protein CFN78_17865 [Amycolatopsis antarctica]